MSDEIDQTRNDDNQQTNPKTPEFDFASFPPNTLFHDRRNGLERRLKGTDTPEQKVPVSRRSERRARKDRRRHRSRPSKTATDDELEFMNAMPVQGHYGKNFPTPATYSRSPPRQLSKEVMQPEQCCDGPSRGPALISPSSVEVWATLLSAATSAGRRVDKGRACQTFIHAYKHVSR
jgi:hypothetical protein